MGGVYLFGSWTQHWDPSLELFFYYDGRTGVTTWDRPHPPGEVGDSPNVIKRGESREAIFPPVPGKPQCPEKANVHNMRRNNGSRAKNRALKKSAQHTKDQDENPRKDYLGFAKEYTSTAPFRETSGNQTCVICQNRKAWAVFFPCEHKCACKRCTEAGGYGKTANEGGLCPVCCQQVAFVVPYKDGSEAIKYWRWVQEVKPPLPKGFRERFHMAALLLKIKSEPDSHKTWDRPSTCCVVS